MSRVLNDHLKQMFSVSVGVIRLRSMEFVGLRPIREFFTHIDTSQLPMNGFKCWPILGTHGHWTSFKSQRELRSLVGLGVKSKRWNKCCMKCTANTSV